MPSRSKTPGDSLPPAVEGPRGVARSLDAVLGFLVTTAMAGAGIAAVGIIAIGTADTLGRLIGKPVMGAVEMSEALLASVIFLALPYVQRKGGHVVVDIVIQSASPRLRKVSHFIALVLTLLAFVLLAKQSYDGAVHSWQVNEVSAGYLPVPVWLAKAL